MNGHKSPNADFHHLFHLDLDPELLEMGLFQLFRNLGKAMLALALPYHLYTNLNYEIWQICAFYAIWQLAFTITMPFVGGIIQQWGLKHSMSASTISSAIFWASIPILLQGNFATDLLCMLPVFLLRATGVNIFTVAYDIFLTHHLNQQKSGRVIANLQIAILLASLLAPIIGAYVTVQYGIEITSYLAIAFFLVGGAILFLTPDEKVKVPYTPQKMALDTFKETPKQLHMAGLGWAFYDSIIWVVWPLFLVIVVDDLLSMSLLVGVSSFLAIIVTYIMGKKIDQKPKASQKLLLHGAIRGMVINLFRAVSLSPFIVLFVDFLNKINLQTITVSHEHAVYTWLHERNTYERAHIRWWIIQTGYTIMFMAITPLFYIFDHEPRWLFITLFLMAGICLAGISQVSKINQIPLR